MKQDTPTQLNSLEKATELVRKSTPYGIVEQLSKQIQRCDEASRRIDEEGIVVRDMKGSVIKHPAIEIEIKAGKIVTELLIKYGKTGNNNT